MSSFREMGQEVASIKQSSEDFAASVSMACQELQGDARRLAAIMEGNSKGQRAVAATFDAARSLSQAGASMLALSRTCDEAMRVISGDN